jgi:hypothetical protein
VERQLLELNLEFPLFVVQDVRGLHGSIRNGQMLNLSNQPFSPIITNYFQSIIYSAKQSDVSLDFVLTEQQPDQLQLYIYDLIDCPEWRCKYPMDGDHAHEYYTRFCERYVRYCVWCQFHKFDQTEIIPVEYTRCLNISDVLEVIESIDTQVSNSVILRDPCAYYCQKQQTILSLEPTEHLHSNIENIEHVASNAPLEQACLNLDFG